jgi:tetratricopeptide (TPR) repeat protein
MAEEQEEIIIIQDDEAAASSASAPDDSAQLEVDYAAKEAKKKKTILIASAATIFILLLTIIGLLLYKKMHHTPEENALQFLKGNSNGKKATIEQSELEKIIAKANYLYANGNKEEALNLYEQIALYSEGVSQYNLGVAQLKEGQYDKALETFKKAIQNNEKVCVSAINAAVCAHELGQPESFKYYVNLAFTTLPNEANSPLYSYYYALIQYYKGNNIEALSALNHPNSDEYLPQRQLLKAKINAALGNYEESITALAQPSSVNNALAIGQMYANLGDISSALQYLNSATTNGKDPLQELLSLALVNIKAGQLPEAAKQLNLITDRYQDQAYKPYPIRVSLKDTLFDPEVAQASFRNRMDSDYWVTYQKIFYFAPYKVFNASSTISYIRKGNANVYIDDITAAKEYLEKSTSASTVNYGIAQAIKKALSFRLRDANKQLLDLEKIQPKHSILQYNIALTYAQIGDIQNAYEHFKRSYHLDSNNYLSGIFAAMCAQMLHVENDKFVSILKDNLANENQSEDTDLYNTLINISQGNMLACSNWINNKYQDRPMYLVLKTMIATKLSNLEMAEQSAKKLTMMLPHDIFPHMLYIDTKLKKAPTKQYARDMLFYMKKQSFNFTDLYYGPSITRYLYVQQALMTGTLYPLQQQLEQALATTQDSPIDIMYVHALANLYGKNPEKAYTLFNQLIDDYKVNDDRTLFFAALAGIAANHHENAIALLELAKMKNPEFLESRFALGLLYMEVKNNKGAAIQFARVSKSNFESDYFTFDIGTEQLYFEKEHHK